MTMVGGRDGFRVKPGMTQGTVIAGPEPQSIRSPASSERCCGSDEPVEAGTTLPVDRNRFRVKPGMTVGGGRDGFRLEAGMTEVAKGGMTQAAEPGMTMMAGFEG
jgi:hypothetical protein